MKKCECSWKLIAGIAAAVVAVAGICAAVILYREKIAGFFRKIGACCNKTADEIENDGGAAHDCVCVPCSQVKDKVSPACEYTEEELSDFADV